MVVVFKIIDDSGHLADLLGVSCQSSLQFLHRQRAIEQEVKSESSVLECLDMGSQVVGKGAVLATPNPLERSTTVEMMNERVSIKDEVALFGENVVGTGGWAAYSAGPVLALTQGSGLEVRIETKNSHELDVTE